MSTHRRERPAPSQSAMRGINRAQATEKTVTFRSSDDPDDPSPLREDDDINYRGPALGLAANKHVEKADVVQAAPVSRNANNRLQSHNTRSTRQELGRAGASGRHVPEEAKIIPDEDDYYDDYYESTAIGSEESYYDEEPEYSATKRAPVPIARDFSKSDNSQGDDETEDSDHKFMEAASNLDQFYADHKTFLYPNDDGALFNPSKTASGDWRDDSDNDNLGFERAAANAREFAERQNLLPGPDNPNRSRYVEPSESYTSPNWKEIDAWDSEAEAASNVDQLYKSMGLAEILSNKEPIVNGASNIYNMNGSRSTNTLEPETELNQPRSRPLKNSDQRPGPGLRKPNSSPRKPKTGAKSGKAAVKVTSAGSPYIERLKQEKTPYAGTGARVPALDLSEYEKKLIAEMNASIQAVKDLGPPPISNPSRKHANPPKLAPFGQPAETSKKDISNQHAKLSRKAVSKQHDKASRGEVYETILESHREEALADPKGYRNRRVFAYTFLIGFLVFLLHNTSVLTTQTILPCPRRPFLAPSQTLHYMGTSIVSIPKSMACSIFPCKSKQRARLRTIEMLAEKVGDTYGAYQAYAASVDIIEEQTHMRNAAERFGSAKTELHHDGHQGDQVVKLMADTHEQFIRANASLKNTLVRAKKLCNFTSDNIVEYLEYLTSQIPPYLRAQLNLPAGWDTSAIMDDRRDSAKSMRSHDAKVAREISKAFKSFVEDIQDLHWEIDAAFDLMRQLVDFGVPNLDDTLNDVKLAMKAVSDLSSYTAWCGSHFLLLKYDESYVNDDSRKMKLSSVESAWDSVISFDSEAIGRRKSYKRMMR